MHLYICNMDPFFIFGIFALIFSIIVHEVMHGVAAYMLGDLTAKMEGRLTINPLPHIDPIGSVLLPAILILSGSGFLFGWAKPVPFNPYNLRNQRWGEAVVAAAGPGINLLIALVFGFGIRFFGGALSEAALALTAQVVFINLLLCCFNLIPIPPLDGSKVLRAILPWRAAEAFDNMEEFLRRIGPIGLFLVLLIFSTTLWPIFARGLSTVFFLITGSSLG